MYRPKRQLVVHAEGLVLRFFNFYPQPAASSSSAPPRKASACAPSARCGAAFSAPRWRTRAIASCARASRCRTALTPIYPTTDGLKQQELRAARARGARRRGARRHAAATRCAARSSLADFAASVQLLHRPPPGTDRRLASRTHPAWRRVKFDELLAQQLSMRFAYRRAARAPAPVLKVNGPLLKAFLESLPFKLTNAQTRAMNEVLRDLREPHPMQRLLQGDVGSGKTIVAAIACLAAVDSGAQAAVMAPTEILSEQHWRKFNEWLAPLGVRLGWLHGGMPQEASASADARGARRSSARTR